MLSDASQFERRSASSDPTRVPQLVSGRVPSGMPRHPLGPVTGPEVNGGGRGTIPVCLEGRDRFSYGQGVDPRPECSGSPRR